VLSIIIALSLVISNITAAAQTSVKRMLAYSSISHAAFMLMAILAVHAKFSVSSILYYTLAYSIGSIASFTVLYNVSKDGDETFDSFNGLAKRNPMIALGMLISMLSLAGIPVTAGFFAKYFIFTTLITSPYKWLLIVAVLTSCVGAYYYFKVIIAMYFKKSDKHEPVAFEMSHAMLLAITAAITILLGLMPDFIVGML
jgi:NADH-quinone oxidoreductase subunit N